MTTPKPSDQMTVSEKPSAGAFALVSADRTATIVVASEDIQPTGIAANLLADDVARVTGKKPVIVRDLALASGEVVIMGTLGHSSVVDKAVAAAKIDVASLRGKWETYLIQVVDHPFKNVPRALVIIGSDRRGTAYGALTLSRAIGVSPWYWWADVPAKHHQSLYVGTGAFSDGAPLVKYRGIFLNDEAPALTGWAKEKFGGLNSIMYGHVFELLLRLKANYLWPAMWGNAFNEDDPLSPKLADDYGIVMGTSHQEPMLRAQKEFDKRYPVSDWNYATSPELLQKFWREGIARNKNYESIITIGLRGRNDGEMIKGGTVAESSALLEKIVTDQRKILSEELDPDVTKIPQLWCLYKEVQSYYEHGLRVPDDVTLLWTDDNWGDLRRLPTAEERKRSGGAGIYYHFDYVGGPRNYRWINTNPLGKMWEQLNLAYSYGADRVWIVNVGDLKPMELPIEFFMTMAWNPPAMTSERERDFSRSWAAAIFGEAQAAEIATFYDWYTRMNGRRKPEMLNTKPEGAYSLTHYNEANEILDEAVRIVTKAEIVGRQLPKSAQDAYFQLILYPVMATANVNRFYILAGLNRLYAMQHRAAANRIADQVRVAFAADAEMTNTYHKAGGGRWNHMMDQVHLGYEHWYDPPANALPPLASVDLLSSPALGLAVEDHTWPDTNNLQLKPIDSANRQTRGIEVFNRGDGVLSWTAKASAPWIVLDTKRNASGDGRLSVSVDWQKLIGPEQGTVEISASGTKPVSIQVSAKLIEIGEPGEVGAYVEGDGVVSIDAAHYSVKMDRPGAAWREIDSNGRTNAAMTVFPVTAQSVQKGASLSDMPSLRYRVYLAQPGTVALNLYVSPTLNFVPGRGLRYAIAIDNAAPQTIDILSDPSGKAWEAAVSANVRISQTQHAVAQPGFHTIKIWMVDPGVVLQKIVVDAGGLRDSYLGPPESLYVKGRLR